ncbi:condensation domain-containing protein [Microbacterium enclense]|uniref:condensation domain-containing protein n=1 Tax=Microbacterium enclense TaxID=993073 RepID=UPI003F7DE602
MQTRVLTASEMRKIWAEELRLERVEEDDDFFQLGGSSLDALAIVARLRDLGYETSVLDVLSSPTAADLASALMSRASAGPGDTPRRAAEGPFPLSQQQKGFWFLVQEAPSHLLNLDGHFRYPPGTTVDQIRDAVEALVDRNEALRTRVLVDRVVPQQIVLDHWVPPVDVIDLREDSAAETRLAELLHRDARIPLDFDRPLFRATIFQLPHGEMVLGVVVHHLMSDALSGRVIRSELNELILGRGLVALTPIGVVRATYRDYVTEQAEWLRTGAEKDREFWRAALDGRSNPTRFHVGASVEDAGVHSLSQNLGTEVALSVIRAAKGAGVTPNAYVLAAFFVVLGRALGDTRIVVGTPSSGRHDARFRDVVGLFASTFPTSAHLDPEQSFSRLAGAVQQSLMAGLAHSRLPSSSIAQATRGLREGALYEISFQFAEFLPPPFMNPGLDLSLNCRLDDDGFDVQLNYNPTRLDERRARDLLDDVAVVVGIVATERAPLVGDLLNR